MAFDRLGDAKGDLYLRSSRHTWESDWAYVFASNTLYEYLISHPYETCRIYDNMDKDAYLAIIKMAVSSVPAKYYDRDFENDWSCAIGGGDNGFMNTLRKAYKNVRWMTLPNASEVMIKRRQIS